MKKTKIKIIIIVLIIILIFISNLDKKLRYNIGLIDYYKYNAKLMDDEFKLIIVSSISGYYERLFIIIGGQVCDLEYIEYEKDIVVYAENPI